MKLSLDGIVGVEELKNNFDKVAEKLKVYEEIIIVDKEGMPKYKLSYLKLNEIVRPKAKCATLVEAIERVLSVEPGNTLHVDQIVKDIEWGNLYFKKDGSRAKREDVRATAQNYPDKFECLKGNNIRLIREPGIVNIVKSKK